MYSRFTNPERATREHNARNRHAWHAREDAKDRRFVRIALLIVLFVLFGCASNPRRDLPTASQQAAPDPLISVVQSDSAFKQFLGGVRSRMFGHKTEADQENVACLYGLVRGDTAQIAFIRPTVIEPIGSSMVAYKGCDIPNPETFGKLQYLGTWHTHWFGVDCGFSIPDTHSFVMDLDAVIEVVSCSQGLIWRSK